MEKNIHWFPGHMKKALGEMEKRLRLVDIVIELVDSRAPISSRNNSLSFLYDKKMHLIVFTKADLADKNEIKKWESSLNNTQNKVIFADLNNEKSVKNIVECAKEIGEKALQKNVSRGINRKAIRAMIIGIPNVGKSTLINKISRRKSARVENRPGLTRSEQWIKISDSLELLDTPGILPSSYVDKEVSIKLALLGSMREDILPLEELFSYLINFYRLYYPNFFLAKYKLTTLDGDDLSVLQTIANNRNFMSKSGLDTTRALNLVLKDFRNGEIGKICLDRFPH